MVEVVKIEPGQGFKRYLQQMENALLFCKRFKMPTFSQFSPWHFFENSTASYVDSILRLKDRKNSIFQNVFILLYLHITCYRDMEHTCVSTYKNRSSYIIKHWPAGNFMKNESILAYYCSTPKEPSIKRITRIVSKTSKKLSSWLPRQVQARLRCHRQLWITGCDTQISHQRSKDPRSLAKQHVLTKIVQALMPMLISQGKPTLHRLSQNRTNLRKSAPWRDNGHQRRSTLHTWRCVARLWKWWAK